MEKGNMFYEINYIVVHHTRTKVKIYIHTKHSKLVYIKHRETRYNTK